MTNTYKKLFILKLFVTAQVDAKIVQDVSDESLYVIIRIDKFTLAVGKDVWRAIDKGRQNISIRRKRGRPGSLGVKGFTLTR
jgi:hypothetical protein